MKTKKKKYKMRNNVKAKLIVISIIIAVIGFLTSGCGGSSGSSNADATDTSASQFQGTFIDSPVQGLDYFSASSSGVTDEDGHFMYYEGEMMTFAMGDVVLGQAMASEIMTPLDFIDESERPLDVTHPTVTNMGRFIQSLDVDGNPENGIVISDDVKAEINGRMIDFHQSVMGFESDSDTEALFNTLNGLNMPHNGLMWGLVTIENAQQHMSYHLSGYMDGYMNEDTMGSGSGNNRGSR